jgi:hypothetical protein
MSGLDFFKLLEVKPLPILDEQVLKSNYLRLSSTAHPDRAASLASGAFVVPGDPVLLNQAYSALSRIPGRLRHLLTLHGGKDPGSPKQIPQNIGERFMEVGELIHSLDSMRQGKPEEGSGEIARVIFIKQSLGLKKRTEAMQTLLRSDLGGLHERLERVHHEWEHGSVPLSTSVVEALTDVYHEWTFLDRWLDQLNTRLLELLV